MKNLIKLPAIVLGLMLLLTGTTQKVMAQDEDISLQSFYDELSPYGTWIQDPQYGYVWRPDVGQGDFRPYYTNGRWVMTEYGNTWVSNYDWGWAPFHYGRWVYNRYNQWVWIPDTVWGPAWVSWRTGGGYYGWAPMGPGMNINVNFNIPDLWWVFVPHRSIYYSSFPRYYSRRNVTIIHNTTIINNVYTRNRRSYYAGPRADDIRRYTRRDVPVYTVNRTSRPSRTSVSNNRVDIYTPSRSSRTAVTGPREVMRGEGYATARPDRVSATNGRSETPSRLQGRGEQGTVNNSRPERVSRPESPANSTQRETGRISEASRTQRPERVAQPSQERDEPLRQERVQQQPQRVEQPRVEQPQRNEQPQQRQERVQQQPQRTEQPRLQQQRQEQPQRQERVQPQRAEQPRQQRAEPSRPSRSSEGRSSSGAGRESASRSSRGRG